MGGFSLEFAQIYLLLVLCGGELASLDFYSRAHLFFWEVRACLNAVWWGLPLTTDNNGRIPLGLAIFLVNSSGLWHCSWAVGSMWSAGSVLQAFWAVSWMVFAFLAI